MPLKQYFSQLAIEQGEPAAPAEAAAKPGDKPADKKDAAPAAGGRNRIEEYDVDEDDDDDEEQEQIDAELAILRQQVQIPYL